jgi:phenylalanyl-tRNA synthetase beta chain
MPLTAERVSAFAGLPIAADRIIEIFEGLGFAPMREGDDIVVTAPSHRVDIQVTADLYEEVIRHVGYNTVPSVLPPTGTPPGHRHPNWELVDRGRNAAVACGLEEALTYAFIDPDDDARVAAWPLCPGKPIPLDNPLARQQGTMRRSLIPGLLTSARDAVNQGERSIALFEQGRAFAAKDASGAHEPERLGVVLAGAAAGHAADEVGFADLKGVVESLLDRIGFVDCGWSRGGAPWLDEQQGAIITDGRGAAIGAAGLLSAAEAKHFGFKIPVYVAELDLQAAPAELPLPRFAALPRFPEITADTTVEHGADLGLRRPGDGGARTRRRARGERADAGPLLPARGFRRTVSGPRCGWCIVIRIGPLTPGRGERGPGGPAGRSGPATGRRVRVRRRSWRWKTY